jgi:tetratricopeptide (TPR) repeat protein
MKAALLRHVIALAILLVSPTVLHAQDPVDVDSKYKTADTNNAVIEGRVSLPSGLSAERNIRITLRTSVMTLSNRYTDKHGEFRFDNLGEGIYYVQAQVDGEEFEPVVQKIALGRGIISEVTLQLRAKTFPLSLNTSRVVSVAELRQVVPSAARKEYELGLKLVAKGDVVEAASHFQQAVSLYPEYLAARNDLGAQFLKLKRIDEAEKAFQTVIEKDPKNFNAKFNLGLVRIERKDFLDAINQLNQAIAIDSTRPVARLWLGVASLESGDVPSAERELTKAVVMGGLECVSAHYHLARIYSSRGDTSEALRAVRAYLDEAPKGEYVSEARELQKKLQQQSKR